MEFKLILCWRIFFAYFLLRLERPRVGVLPYTFFPPSVCVCVCVCEQRFCSFRRFPIRKKQLHTDANQLCLMRVCFCASGFCFAIPLFFFFVSVPVFICSSSRPKPHHKCIGLHIPGTANPSSIPKARVESVCAARTNAPPTETNEKRVLR